MTDLNELRKQRDALTRRIQEAERSAADRWNDALDELDTAIAALASARGLPVDATARKNVRTLAVGPVVVELGYIQALWGAWLGVRCGELRIGFSADGDAPSPAVMTSLLQALLDEEAGS